MPKTPRVYVAFCFYICNLNAALAMLGKFLEFAGMLCNLHIKWLIFAQDWWVWNGLSLLNSGMDQLEADQILFIREALKL